VIVKDIYPGPESSYPYELKYVNGILFFAARDGTHGWELWKSESISEYQVEIDILPWSDTNPVNRNKKGVIPVAILGSDAFDPTALDPSMMSFGFCGATQTAHDLTDPDVFSHHCVQPYYDESLGKTVTANDDEYPDLVIHFNVRDFACLSGYDRKDVVPVELEIAYNGVTYIGSDDIRIVK
jgi:ELWxxDGT repeat protein